MTNTDDTPTTTPDPAPAAVDTPPVLVLEEVRSYALLDTMSGLETEDTWETPQAAQEAANGLGYHGQFVPKFRQVLRFVG